MDIQQHKTQNMTLKLDISIAWRKKRVFTIIGKFFFSSKIYSMIIYEQLQNDVHQCSFAFLVYWCLVYSKICSKQSFPPNWISIIMGIEDLKNIRARTYFTMTVYVGRKREIISGTFNYHENHIIHVQ